MTKKRGGRLAFQHAARPGQEGTRFAERLAGSPDARDTFEHNPQAGWAGGPVVSPATGEDAGAGERTFQVRGPGGRGWSASGLQQRVFLEKSLIRPAGHLLPGRKKEIRRGYFNSSFTAPLALPKSIWPGKRSFKAAMTRPMSLGPSAPSSAISAVTAAFTAPSSICCGR